MGQKINPKSLRIGITKPWPSRWFFSSLSSIVGGEKAKGSRRRVYAHLLKEDEAIRNIIRKKVSNAGIAGIEIERTAGSLKVIIKTARPGFIIGKGGKGIEELTSDLENNLKSMRSKEAPPMHLSLNIEELKRTEVSAAYTAQQVAWDLERRLPYRRTLKKYLDQLVQHKEVIGAKIMASGRLGGAEIARSEQLKHGSLPLHTIRADIDYGTALAKTTYGTIGVKAWIYKRASRESQTVNRK